MSLTPLFTNDYWMIHSPREGMQIPASVASTDSSPSVENYLTKAEGETPMTLLSWTAITTTPELRRSNFSAKATLTTSDANHIYEE